MRLDFENGRQAVADVHGPAFSPGALHDAAAGRRQFPEVHARALVAAVFGPHHGKMPSSVNVGSRPSTSRMR